MADHITAVQDYCRLLCTERFEELAAHVAPYAVLELVSTEEKVSGSRSVLAWLRERAVYLAGRGLDLKQTHILPSDLRSADYGAVGCVRVELEIAGQYPGSFPGFQPRVEIAKGQSVRLRVVEVYWLDESDRIVHIRCAVVLEYD